MIEIRIDLDKISFQEFEAMLDWVKNNILVMDDWNIKSDSSITTFTTFLFANVDEAVIFKLLFRV
jgi:hypothetical protein